MPNPHRGQWTTQSPAVTKLWRRTWKISLIFHRGPLRRLIVPPWWCVTAVKYFFLTRHTLTEESSLSKRRERFVKDVTHWASWKWLVCLVPNRKCQATFDSTCPSTDTFTSKRAFTVWNKDNTIFLDDHNYQWKPSYKPSYLIIAPALTSVMRLLLLLSEL